MTSIAARPSIATMPPIVSATAAPTSSGPSVLKTVASTIACAGVAARVATSVAMAFDASWIPFVKANAKTKTSAIASSVVIAPPGAGRAAPA